MIDFLTSDPAIVIFSVFGLLATAITIFSDARAQYAKVGVKRPLVLQELPASIDRREIAA